MKSIPNYISKTKENKKSDSLQPKKAVSEMKFDGSSHPDFRVICSPTVTKVPNLMSKAPLRPRKHSSSDSSLESSLSKDELSLSSSLQKSPNGLEKSSEEPECERFYFSRIRPELKEHLWDTIIAQHASFKHIVEPQSLQYESRFQRKNLNFFSTRIQIPLESLTLLNERESETPIINETFNHVINELNQKYPTFSSFLLGKSKAEVPVCHSMIWLIKTLESVYEKRTKFEEKRKETEKSVSRISFPEFTFKLFEKQLGLGKRCYQFCWELLFSLDFHRNTQVHAELFANFLSEEYSLDDLLFFLTVRNQSVGYAIRYKGPQFFRAKVSRALSQSDLIPYVSVPYEHSLFLMRKCFKSLPQKLNRAFIVLQKNYAEQKKLRFKNAPEEIDLGDFFFLIMHAYRNYNDVIAQYCNETQSNSIQESEEIYRNDSLRDVLSIFGFALDFDRLDTETQSLIREQLELAQEVAVSEFVEMLLCFSFAKEPKEFDETLIRKTSERVFFLLNKVTKRLCDYYEENTNSFGEQNEIFETVSHCIVTINKISNNLSYSNQSIEFKKLKLAEKAIWKMLLTDSFLISEIQIFIEQMR